MKKIMKAEEARQTAKWMDSIYGNIKEACQKGLFELEVTSDIPELALESLKGNGYECIHNTNRGVAPSTVTIKW